MTSLVGPGLFRQAMGEEKLAVRDLVDGHAHRIRKTRWPDMLVDDDNRHCTLVRSPRLRSLQVYLALFHHDDEPKSAIEELHSVLKMVQSTNLQILKIRQLFQLTTEFLPMTDSQGSQSRLFYGAPLPETLSQDLHHTMSAHTFDKLLAVEFAFCVRCPGRSFLDASETAKLATVAREISRSVQHLLMPWHNRGLVRVNWTL